MDAERARLVDEEYVKRTSFDVYMVAGIVYILLFTAAFMLTVVYHVERLVWPAALLALVPSYLVWYTLRARERRMRRAEVTANPTKVTQ